MKKLLFALLLLLALAALFISVLAYKQSEKAIQISLSEISVEEKNTFTTPVYDEASKTWNYLAIYEIGITNQGGPPAELTSVKKSSEGSGFIVALKGDEVVNKDIEHSFFLVDASIQEILSDPRLIRKFQEKSSIFSIDMGIKITSGETKTFRIGSILQIYGDDPARPLADMLLLSYELSFANGKNYIFRRGFPVRPVLRTP